MLLSFTTQSDIELYRSYSTKSIRIPQGTFVAPESWARTVQQLYPSTILKPYPDYKPKPNEDYSGKRVLFTRIGGIGDMLFIMPAIYALHKRFPTCEIGMAVDTHVYPLVWDEELCQWYESESLLQWVTGDYDYVINLNEILEVGPRNIDVFDAVANYIGIPTEWLDYKTRVNTRYDWMPDPIPEGEKEITERIDPDKLNIVYQVNAGSPIRTIPEQHARFFLSGIAGQNRKIWLVGKDDQIVGLNSLALLLWNDRFMIPFQSVEVVTGESPADLVALINHADIVVSSDSVSVHIAAALGKPCLAVYNAFAPEHYASHYPTVVPIDVRSNCEFADEKYRKCFQLGEKCDGMRKANSNTAPCWDYLDVIEMIRKFEEMVKAIKK
ncbi:MAG: hypothetical protein KGJ90_02545 [Patescibacteria group bacterium]|nr:hypothetical protein [Patescibacteria group bacterium]